MAACIGDALAMIERRFWFLAGLFLTTLSALCLEVLATRLLSVMTWYHLSFFAVSTAMFGMAAGALQVYLGGQRFSGAEAPRALARYAALFALMIPVCHIALLCIPVPVGFSTHALAVLLSLTLLLAVPFYCAGVVVTLALTRIPGKIGLYYAVDLVGAALGALLVLPLLENGDISSAHLWCAALAAAAACCFRVFAGMPRSFLALGLLAVFSATAWMNPRSNSPLAVWFSKGQLIHYEHVTDDFWNIHAQLLVRESTEGGYQYWGAGESAPRGKTVQRLRMVLDGDAGTVMTEWDESRKGLDWVKYDVTALPYHLRKRGDVAVIGVGGGRDLLTALWSECESVRGVEINGHFIELLEGQLRDYAHIADQPEVSLIHDEARSYFTRCEDDFDIIQMSLIDTWAATGAGAFTLTENGLYTMDAWRVFLERLKPGGIFSVSRWYHPENVSESNRLLALGVAALLERGVSDPSKHIALVSRHRVGNLMVSPSPLTDMDLERIHAVADALQFRVLAAPDTLPDDEQMLAIYTARSDSDLAVAVQHDIFDYTPPTDERPYFFNILKPRHAFNLLDIIEAGNAGGTGASSGEEGVASGNLAATSTLMMLGLVSLFLVLVVILAPLTARGLPTMKGTHFVISVLYFASIGLGFMLVQVAFMQRFSVYLGHPTHAVVVILFSMILASGVGSFLSDRIDVESRNKLTLAFPLAICLLLFIERAALQTVIESTLHLGLVTRSALVVLMVVPVSVLLGLCFPIGMRLVQRLSNDAAPWMWGVNGASGVLGAVLAVGISMWAGIGASLVCAALLYASVTIYARFLAAAPAAGEKT
jgi:spermidine synthase